MKNLVFKRSSWHYKLATMSHRHPRNICEYLREVIKNLILISLVCVVGYFGLWVIVHTVLSIGFSLFYMTDLFTEVGFAGALLLSMAAGAALCVWISHCIISYTAYRREKAYIASQGENYKKAPVVDGFVKNAYKSWKNKYCVGVSFVD